MSKLSAVMKRAFLTFLFLSSLTGNALELKAPKNFVVIFADDFGFGDLGCYNELFQGDDAYSLADEFTPNLDKLGRDGVRFMQTYAASWCACNGARAWPWSTCVIRSKRRGWSATASA